MLELDQEKVKRSIREDPVPIHLLKSIKLLAQRPTRSTGPDQVWVLYRWKRLLSR